MDVAIFILLAVAGIIALTLILENFFTVDTAKAAIITRFGNFCAWPKPA